jgi:hypothetical protein
MNLPIRFYMLVAVLSALVGLFGCDRHDRDRDRDRHAPVVNVDVAPTPMPTPPPVALPVGPAPVYVDPAPAPVVVAPLWPLPVIVVEPRRPVVVEPRPVIIVEPRPRPVIIVPEPIIVHPHHHGLVEALVVLPVAHRPAVVCPAACPCGPECVCQQSGRPCTCKDGAAVVKVTKQVIVVQQVTPNTHPWRPSGWIFWPWNWNRPVVWPRPMPHTPHPKK